MVPRERPDFELRFANGRVVGLEVTELTHEGVAVGQNVVRRLRDAVSAGLAAKGLEASVAIRFGDGSLSLLAPREQMRAHADAIVALVEGHQRRGAPMREYKLRGFLNRNGLPFLKAVHVGPGLAVWTSETAVGQREPFVQDRIDAKNGKVASYRAALPGRELWLLLVTNSFRSAVWNAVFDGHVYRSAFDRTFCLDAYAHVRRVIDVATAG